MIFEPDTDRLSKSKSSTSSNKLSVFKNWIWLKFKLKNKSSLHRKKNLEEKQD